MNFRGTNLLVNILRNPFAESKCVRPKLRALIATLKIEYFLFGGRANIFFVLDNNELN